MHKLEWQVDGVWVPHSHAPVFTTESFGDRPPRLLASVPNGDAKLFLNLLDCLAPPFYLLYVLHTPRGEGEAGRYQSESLEDDEVRAFVNRFSSFLSGDARFDLWAHSPAAGGTIVWDRHNLIYGYGPIGCFSEVLISSGFSVGVPRVPDAHAHRYREEFDGDANALLSAFSWQHFELRPEDEQ